MKHNEANCFLNHAQSVTYWYGLPAASLVLTDELNVGHPKSEQTHQYSSPDASEPYELTSRYEWGIDQFTRNDQARVLAAPRDYAEFEFEAAHTETGRTTTTSSEFTLKLCHDNLGVLLRRTLDYGFPNQRAEVYVAAVGEGQPQWKEAGVWYLAGSNTCYHSYPRKAGELGKSEPVVQTSNRRFRDDEFLIPRALTEGCTSIRVRVEFTPVKIPLLPGRRVGELAWSEIRYRAYCYMMPAFTLP